MIRQNARQLPWAVVLFTAVTWIVARQALAVPASTQPSTRPAGRLVVVADGAPLAGRPVVLRVILTNTGDGPISYWFAGPGDYPAADHFVLTVTGADGESRELTPGNGQYVEGSGIFRKIRPGETVRVPLAIAPLPAGDWLVQVATHEEAYGDGPSGKKHVYWPEIPKTAPRTITVVEDAEVVVNWDRRLLDKVRKGDPFARYLAADYHIQFVIAAMLSDLVSDDDKVAFAAEQTLFIVRPFPPSADTAIETAISNQLHRPPFKSDLNLLACLVFLSQEAPTDEMLESVLAVAHSDVGGYNGEVRGDAVEALRYFPQKRAADEVRAFLHDDNEFVRNAAKGVIARPLPRRAGTSLPEKFSLIISLASALLLFVSWRGIVRVVLRARAAAKRGGGPETEHRT